MKQVISFALCCLAIGFINGCGGEQKAVAIRKENRLNITKINLGMTRAEVLQIMGDKSAQASFGKNTVTVTNPYKSEIRQMAGVTYEVLYYYTHQDQKDWPGKRFKILDRELTPIVFQDGKVIGWGAEFLAQMPFEK